MNMYGPIAVIVLSNIFYNLSSRATPKGADPFASLTVTYLVGAAVSGALFFLTNRGASLAAAWRDINWSAWVLGLSVVGLEAGSIAMYKAGWDIGAGHLVHSGILSVCLLVIGALAFKEKITWERLLGAGLVLTGLFFIGR